MAPYCESVKKDHAREISCKSEIPNFCPQGKEKTLLAEEDVVVSMDSLISVVSSISNRCKEENMNGLTELEKFFTESKGNFSLMEILTNGTIYGIHSVEEDLLTRIVYFAFPTKINENGQYLWNCIRYMERYSSNIDDVPPEGCLDYLEGIEAGGDDVFDTFSNRYLLKIPIPSDSFSSGQVVKDFFASAETIVQLSKTPTYESAVPTAKDLKKEFLDIEAVCNKTMIV